MASLAQGLVVVQAIATAFGWGDTYTFSYKTWVGLCRGGGPGCITCCLQAIVDLEESRPGISSDKRFLSHNNGPFPDDHPHDTKVTDIV